MVKKEFRSDEVCDVHWHFVNAGGVVALDVLEGSDVVVFDEVDGDALLAEAARPAYPVDVELPVEGEVVVDHERDLLDIQAPCPDVRGDQDPRGARPELRHDELPLALGHVAVHRGDREVVRAHLVRQPLDLPPLVAEDHGLRDGQRVVQVAQRVKLPLLLLHRHEELLDPVQRQLVALHQDPDRIRHELARHFKHIPRQRRRHQHHLRLRRQVTVNVIDLFLEAPAQHLVRLVQDEQFDVPRPHRAALDHVVQTAGGAADHVHPALQLANILAHTLPADAAVRLHVHEVADREDHLVRLRRQLASRGHDQGLHFSSGGFEVLAHGQ
mmetsp:Transcript_29253/g.61929  ORF Transcript_29253/g.61929 Transcript_29253/m.61929 type:complete len:327 (+) Transcript_29253:678-1658(+)